MANGRTSRRAHLARAGSSAFGRRAAYASVLVGAFAFVVGAGPASPAHAVPGAEATEASASSTPDPSQTPTDAPTLIVPTDPGAGAPSGTPTESPTGADPTATTDPTATATPTSISTAPIALPPATSGPVIGDACPTSSGLPLWHTPPSSARTVALTFDDGPGETSRAMLAELRGHGVRGTFFVVGRRAALHPEIVAEEAADGNVIADHTWTHPTTNGGFFVLGAPAIAAQLDQTQTLLRGLIGSTPCFFRAPQGRDDSPLLPGAVIERRLTVTHWTASAQDYAQPDHIVPAEVSRITKALINAGPHPIILMHDGARFRGNTVLALGRIIDWYASHGYTFTDPLGRPIPAPHAVATLTPAQDARLGAPVEFTGTLAGGAAGARVTLRRLDGGHWSDAGSTLTGTGGGFQVSGQLRHDGATWFRVSVNGQLSPQVAVVVPALVPGLVRWY